MATTTCAFHRKVQGLMMDLHWTARFMNMSPAGNRVSSLKTSTMQSLPLCTRRRERSQTDETIKGSPFSPSPQSSLQSCSTGLYQPSPKKISQKPVWLQSKQRHKGHGVHSLAITRRVPQTKQRNACCVLTKAFDTISRKGLWLILQPLGCPPKFVEMVIQLHEGQCSQIRLNSNLSPSPMAWSRLVSKY